MKEPSLSALSRVGAFSALDARILARAAEAVRHQIKRFGRNAVIHFQGDPYTCLLVLLRGEVDALMRDFDGKTLKIESLRGPEALAPGILFAEDSSLPVTLAAKTDVDLLVLPKSSVVAIGRGYPDFLPSLLRGSGNRIAMRSRKLRLLQFATLRGKVAGCFVDCAEKQGTETRTLDRSKEELAELFGAARPSVSRTFSELRDSGLLALDGRMVCIPDRDALGRIARGEGPGGKKGKRA